jgi:hypothetical protein
MPVVPPNSNHRQIPHDPHDRRPIHPQETDIKFFEKHINSLHSLMIQKGQLPSMDPIRRAAEEVDGLFATQNFTANLPADLQHRWPDYSERRVLAVEIVLRELGYLTADELQRGQAETPAATGAIAYRPNWQETPLQGPQYAVGEPVQIRAEAPPGHIRTPLYLLGKCGRIANIQGQFPDPAAIAHFQETVSVLPLYLVEFDMTEVWGAACPTRSRNDTLRVEIYEPWLTPITST